MTNNNSRNVFAAAFASQSRNIVISALIVAASVHAKTSTTPTASPSSTAPAPAASPSSSAPFESQMLAYGALDHIASSIAATTCSSREIHDTPTIVIFDQPSFATLQTYQAFAANKALVIGAYKTLLKGDPAESAKLLQELTDLFHSHEQDYQLRTNNAGGTPEQRELSKHLSEDWQTKEFALTATGPAFGDPISDLTGLLSAIAISSNTETAGAITIPDSALAVLVTRKLAKDPGCAGKAIVYPPLYGHGSSSDFSSADIQADIQEVDDVRKLVHNQVHDANLAFLVDHKGQQNITGDLVLTAALTDIDGLYDNFVNSLLQVNSSSGLLGSAAVIQGYQLESLLAGHSQIDAHPATARHNATSARAELPPAYVLLASIVASGGTQQVHKTFWTALSTGDKIKYSGGAIVNVSLWKATAQSPVYGQELRYRTPFMYLRPPTSSANLNIGDNLE